jgi:hypothetical protein
MLMTVTNTSGADFAAGDLPHPLGQFAIAAAASVATGMNAEDLLHGRDKGSAAYKELNRLIQTGQITMAATVPGTGDTPATLPIDVMDEAETV